MKRGQFVKWSSRRFDLKSIFLWGRLPVPDSAGWDLQQLAKCEMYAQGLKGAVLQIIGLLATHPFVALLF